MSIDLIAMLSSFHFTQVVNEPTRVARSSSITIDHIYLTTISLLSSYLTCPPLGSTDHRSLQLSLNWTKCPQKTVSRRIWNYLRADWDTISSDLATLPSPTDHVDSFLGELEVSFQLYLAIYQQKYANSRNSFCGCLLFLCKLHMVDRIAKQLI